LEVAMTFKKNVLVVANVTAASDELCRELVARAEREPATFTLLVPATGPGGGRAAAMETVQHAVSRLREAGLEAEGTVGPSDPIIAVTEAWDPRRYDEIIVSTLPIGSSKWLHAGLPERIFKLTGVPVCHIVAQPPKPPVEAVHVEAHDHGKLGGPLTPLSVLRWGKPREDAPHEA
jgi:hypothetical protein